jgi:carbon monoxide dehydrogenase subunit G
MSDISRYESRTGLVNESSQNIYMFITDVRNFEQLIRGDSLTDIRFEPGSISFKAGMLGTVSIRLSGKTEFTEVNYSGSAMQVNDFTLSVYLNELKQGSTEVRVLLSVALNPLLKMMAAEPIRAFLDRLISEMESFSYRQNIKDRTQVP